MKVALVYDFFPHYRGAIMRELLNHSRHDYLLVADEKPIDPTIKPWPVEDPARFVSAPYRRLFGPCHVQTGLLPLALRRDIGAIVFMAYPNFLTTWLSALVARWSGKRVYFWTHGWNRSERGPKAWLRRRFYRLADGLLLYGHLAKSFGIQHGFPPERLHVIYNSLDYERQRRIRDAICPGELAALRARHFARPELPLAVCSARLIRACRFDLLLAAQRQLRDEGHPINVLLIGDGPERAALQREAETSELPVCFHGACYEEMMLARLLAAAHVTVSPGKVGLTAMHSLAYGTPVITHDDPEAQGPEWEAIVPGRTGEFFRQGDAADLARVIRRWTAAAPTAEMRAACQRVIEHHYTPRFQRRAIDRAVSGAPADDLFWLKEDPGSPGQRLAA